MLCNILRNLAGNSLSRCAVFGCEDRSSRAEDLYICRYHWRMGDTSIKKIIRRRDKKKQPNDFYYERLMMICAFDDMGIPVDIMHPVPPHTDI